MSSIPQVMKVLKYLGIAAMSVGYLYKVIHWPGSNLLLFAGFVLCALGAVEPVVANWADLAIGAIFRPLLAVLLFGTVLIHFFRVAEAEIIMPGVVVLAITFFIFDGPWSESTRSRELPAHPLLMAGWSLVAIGTVLLLGGWPFGSTVFVFGILGLVLWMSLQGREARNVESP